MFITRDSFEQLFLQYEVAEAVLDAISAEQRAAAKAAQDAACHRMMAFGFAGL